MHFGLGFFAFFLGLAVGASASAGEVERPNIVILLADDLGYSDIGSFGGEIATPNLDRLAAGGLRLSQFYNAAKCCPSRASLLTGQHPHRAGIGLMTDQQIAIPSYQGYLRDDVATLPQVLQAAGYETCLSGKWHVGEAPEHWPHRYGFDEVLALIGGASSYFETEPYRNAEWKWGESSFIVRNDAVFDYPEGTYVTDLYTDFALEFIEGSLQRGTPFFLYLAYTAPHWPLHALPEDIARYEGRYDGGWEELRRQRYARQRASGLFPREWMLPDLNPRVPEWSKLSAAERKDLADEMEVYAAMVDRMDQNIGRLVARLEQAGALENTLILFLSDNGGASAAGVPFLHERYDANAPVGTPRSFDAYGPGWANLSNTPFRLYKAQVHEGGIASPFIAHWPARIAQGRTEHTVGHIVDLLPTCLEAAGVQFPEAVHGRPVVPPAGISLMPVFAGKPLLRATPLSWEHLGNRAVLDGPWKLVQLHGGPWELYNLEADRTESHNLLGEAQPEVIAELLAKYHAWAQAVGAFPREVVEAKVETADRTD